MKRGIVFLGALILLAIVGSLNVSANGKQTAGAPSSIFGPASIVQAQSSGNQLRPVVSQAAHSDVSPPLRSIRPIQPQYDPKRPELRPARINHPKPQGAVNDSTQLTSRFSPLAMPTPIQNFEGIYNLWGGYPPDTNGEVGANNYVQIVNLGFQIWTKTGTSLYGPANFNTLFTGFGGPCEIRNDGDPVVVYDQMANRWLLTQFTTAAPYFQCNALSTSGDPTGSYYRYAFSEAGFEDYPHYGVWPDAYYMSANGNGGAGGHYAYERDRMLVGDPAARQIVFHTADAGLLPSDMDGPTPPPPGSPNYYLEWYTANPGQLREWKYHVDWTTPANSTFSGPTTIPVNNFDVNLSGIPQPGTSVVVDDLSDRLMYRVPYRNFGDHEVLLANHTVRSSTTNVAGIRWYEVRDPAGTPAAFQQGTYSPDTTYRWMASVAMDRMGDIGVGFSASSSTVYPSIRYAGRLVGDPLGELSQGEATIIDGTASQIGTASRWGDYSDITVDPVDDCTFWYTTEYIQVTGERTWRTRIGSFKFPSCTGNPNPTPTVSGPTHTATPAPPASATPCAGSVSFTGSITNTDSIQAGRVGLRAPGSTCAVPKGCAAPGSTENMHYDSYTYANSTGSAQCVTVTLNEACGNNTVWSVAYLGTYNPTSLCTNYLADGGRGGPSTVYSFSLAAGATAVIVVHEVSPNVGCASYTLFINPCGGGPQLTTTPTSTPTVTPTSAIPTITLTPCVITFTDVFPTDYYYEAVRYLYCNGAISGYGDNTFRPNNLTTRGQLCKIVVLAEHFPIFLPPAPTFVDVPADHPFYQYIETAYHQDLISGYTCGAGCLEFRPGNNVTRGQLCKIVVIAEGWSFYNPPSPTFRDVPATDPFYQYIETAYFHQIISGYSCGANCLEFRPGASATRGQISKIVYNAVTAP